MKPTKPESIKTFTLRAVEFMLPTLINSIPETKLTNEKFALTYQDQFVFISDANGTSLIPISNIRCMKLV